ncbi:MAG: hypothetical protein ACO1TE_29340 [Prosthecobacter sp.]
MFRLLRRFLLFVLTSFLLAGGVYVSTDAFRTRWHGFVTGELGRMSVHLDFESLTINPFGGLVAREVKIYNDASHLHLVAAVDRLNLGVDFGPLFEGKVKVKSLDLTHANVALPVDPERPDLTVVELKDLHAKMFLDEDRLDIRQAEGVLAGIHLSISGVLKLPESKPGDDQQPSPSAMERLSAMRQHRETIQRGLDWLARFQSPHAPELRVRVSGDLDLLQELRAELGFHAQGLRYQDYVWQDLVAEAEYEGGFIDLKRLHVQDHLGTLDATATWHMGADRVRFRLNSSADLPGLARAFFVNDQLHEVVFYEAPHLALEGHLFVGAAKPEGLVPAEVTGHLDCGRFGSRGEIFDSLSLSIGATPEGIFVRDAVLKHETGSTTMSVMNHRAQGFKADLALRMNPHVFLPFISGPKTREIIQRFAFQEDSFIDVRMAAGGATTRLKECLISGHGVVRNARYKGVFFESVEMDLAFNGDIHNYYNVRARRPDGLAEAKLVFVNDDDDQKWVRLVGVSTQADAAGILRAFAPKTADQVDRYRFSPGTEVTVNGTLGFKNNPKHNDYRVKFNNPVGGAHYVLWNEDYPINAPEGSIHIVGETLNFDVNGRLFGDTLDVKGSVNLKPEVKDYQVKARAGRFPYAVFGKKLPFQDVSATVDNRGGNIRFDVSSSVLGGGMTLIGSLHENREPEPYEGELRMDSVSFKRFAQVYSPGNESEGDISGHFKFTGRMDDWRQLKGGGALYILNGNLLALPVLGPLTPVIGALLPSPIRGYNIAKEANCTFEVADGFIVTKNIEAQTGSFRISSRGNIDFIRDDIDFTAEVSVRGITGLVLFPVTKLLAFKGSNTIGNTKWSPRIFGGGNKDDRRPPSAEELREAQRIGGGSGRSASKPGTAPTPTPAPPPRRKSLFERLTD